MAIFNFNVDEADNFSVDIHSLIETDCASRYTYKVNAESGDSIRFSLSQGFDNSSYTILGVETEFTSETTIAYQKDLYINFTILNSGVSGVFTNVLVSVDDDTNNLHYEDRVTRLNDSLRCGQVAGGITYDELTDTPDNKTGNSLNLVRVNLEEDALEYVDAGLFVDLTTSQNIGGLKTFSDVVRMNTSTDSGYELTVGVANGSYSIFAEGRVYVDGDVRSTSITCNGIGEFNAPTTTSGQKTVLKIINNSSADQTSAMTADIDFALQDDNTTSSTQARIGIVGSSTGTQDAESGGKLVFYTSTASFSSPTLTERMTIDDQGFVSVGAAQNGYQMTIGNKGSGSIFAFGKIFTSDNVYAVGSITGSSISKVGGTSSQFLKADGSVDSNDYLRSDQNDTSTGTITATNFILSSDGRLKENVEEVSDKSINVDWKTFEMKSNKGQKRYGVIAQELEEVHPEFVRTDDEGMKSVAYVDLLIAKIAELEARLAKVENK